MYKMTKIVLPFVMAFLFLACSENETMPVFDKVELNEYLNNLPSVLQIAPFEERKIIQKNARRDQYTLEEYEVAVGFDEQFLFNPSSEIFYPGSLVVASSVVQGSYKPISVPRAAIVLSTSLTGDKTSITVDSPKLSTTRDAISTLLKDRNFDIPPANLRYTTDEVFSNNHLKIALGGNYEGFGTNVSGSLAFNYEKETTKVVVKMIQKFYTIDVDVPDQSAAFFNESFDFKEKIVNHKPLYVSSVTYGRVFLMSIESTMSKVELEAALQASFLGGSVGVNAETEFGKIVKTSTIKATIVGGSATIAGQEIGDLSAVKEFIASGASYSKENPGLPIAYRLRELGNNEVFTNVLYSKYTKRVKVDQISNKSIDFDINLDWYGLKTKAGSVLKPERVFIRRVDVVTGKSNEKELFFGSEYKVKSRLELLTKKDKVYIVFRDYSNKDTHVFTLPAMLDLIKKGLLTSNGHLYDLDKSPLKTEELHHNSSILTLGIESYKIY